MKSFDIILSSISDVKDFVSAACTMSCDIDLISGRYTIDAKSIMGIFSLDLVKPIKVEIRGSDVESTDFYNKIKKFEI